MSVGRNKDIVAFTNRVDPKRILCKNCRYYITKYLIPRCDWWQETTNPRDFCILWRDKDMADKIVNFHEYCQKCKYESLPESEDPCNSCLTDSVNEDSHQPVEFVEKSAP